jgi:hypothetical protein
MVVVERTSARTAWVVAALSVLLGVGIALRLPALGDWSLFRDDAWQSLATRVGSVSEVVITGGTAPGYALLLRGWSWAFGEGSSSLLSLSALAGLVGILATTLLARRFGLHWASAMVAGTVIAAGSVSIDYSGRVKPFVVDALITVILTWLALDAVERVTKDRVLVLSLLASLAFVFSATSAPVGAVGVAAVAANSWRQSGERTLALWSVFCYSFVTCGWYFLMVRPATTEVLDEFWEGRFVDLSQGLSGVVERGTAFVAGASPGRTHPLALACLLAVGLVTIAARRRWLHGILLLGPVAVTALLSALGVVPFGGGRTDLFLYPMVAIVAGYGTDLLARAWGRELHPWLVIGAASLVMIGFAATAVPGTYPEESGREITHGVLRVAQPTDLIVTLPETSYLWARYAPAEVGVVRDPHSMTGFTPQIDDPRVLFLPGFEMSSAGSASLAAREHALGLTRVQLDVASPRRVWVVEATYFDSPFLELEQLLLDRGYTVSDAVEREFAVALLYTRPRAHGIHADSGAAETNRQGTSLALEIPMRGVAMTSFGGSPSSSLTGEAGSRRSVPLCSSVMPRAWQSFPGPFARSLSRPRRLFARASPSITSPPRMSIPHPTPSGPAAVLAQLWTP